MPITPKQREARRKHVGASDTAAIMGLSPWKTSWDIWAEKTGKLDEEDHLTSEAADLGNLLEPALINWAEDHLGAKIWRNQLRVHKGGILSASHDGLIIAASHGVEVKTTGLVGANTSGWGEEDTDEVPDAVLIQCQHQMIVSDLEMVWVPALIGGRGRVMFRTYRNAELSDRILNTVSEFWENHVVCDVPPADSEPSIETLKQYRRRPGLIVVINPDVLFEYEAAKEAVKEAEGEKEKAKKAIIEALGDAEGANTRDGNSVTFFEQSRTNTDIKGLKFDHPGLVEPYQSKKTYRVLRLKEKLL